MSWVKTLLTWSIGDFLELLNNIGRRERRLELRDPNTLTGKEKGQLFMEASRKSGKSLTQIHQILEHLPESRQTHLLQEIVDGLAIPDSWLKAARRSPTADEVSVIEVHTRRKVEAIAQDIDEKILSHCSPRPFGPADAGRFMKKRKKAPGEVTVYEDTRDGKEVAATADIHGRQKTEEDKAEAKRQVRAAREAKNTLKELRKPGRQVVGVDLRLTAEGGEVPPPQDIEPQDIEEASRIHGYAEVAHRALAAMDVEPDINIKTTLKLDETMKASDIREHILEAYKNGHLTDENAKELIKTINEEFIELPKAKPKEETLESEPIELDDDEMI